jgi:hypothetical protein
MAPQGPLRETLRGLNVQILDVQICRCANLDVQISDDDFRPLRVSLKRDPEGACWV